MDISRGPWKNPVDLLISLWTRGACPGSKRVSFYGQMVVRGGAWFAWVTVTGGAREAARWTSDVSVQGFAAKNLEVHPIDRTVEEILESGKYLALTRQQVRNIKTPPHVECIFTEKED